MTLLAASARRRSSALAGLSTSFETTAGAGRTLYTEERAYLTAFVDHYPHINWINVGTTLQGRAISGITIGTGTGRPVVMLMGIHGNETVPPEAAFTLLRELAVTTDPDLTSLLTARKLVIVPNLNPDGRNWNPMRRTNANNVDLNRDLLHVTQPESRAFVQLIRDLDPIAIVDAHENILAPAVKFIEYGIGDQRVIPADLIDHNLPAVVRLGTTLVGEDVEHGWYIPQLPPGSGPAVFGCHGIPAHLTESSPPMDMRTVETRDLPASRMFRHANNLTAMRAWLHDVATNQAAYEQAADDAQVTNAARTTWDLTGMWPTPRPSNYGVTGTVIEAEAYLLSAAQYATAQAALAAHGITATPDGSDYIVSLGHAKAAIAVQLLDPQAEYRIVDGATRIAP